MSEYERIRKMRLNHAAGCTQPPPTKEPKGVLIQTMSKRMEKDVVIQNHEPFKYRCN